MRITLLRHAQTKGNLLRHYVGVTDQPLAEEGCLCAKQALPNTQVTHVYTSDLQRTQQTAALLFPCAEIISVPHLREMNFGLYEGKSAEDLEHDQDYRAWVRGGCEDSCPGGEDMASFTQRCVQAFFEVLEDAEEKGFEELFFVVHAGTIMALLGTLARPAQPFFTWRASYCSGYILEYETERKYNRPLRLLETVEPENKPPVD